MSTPTRIHMVPRPGQSDDTLCACRTVNGPTIVTSDRNQVTCLKCKRSMAVDCRREIFMGRNDRVGDVADAPRTAMDQHMLVCDYCDAIEPDSPYWWKDESEGLTVCDACAATEYRCGEDLIQLRGEWTQPPQKRKRNQGGEG